MAPASFYREMAERNHDSESRMKISVPSQFWSERRDFCQREPGKQKTGNVGFPVVDYPEGVVVSNAGSQECTGKKNLTKAGKIARAFTPLHVQACLKGPQ